MDSNIKIRVKDAEGCDGCVFDKTRDGQSRNDNICTGSWLMQKTIGVDCSDGYQFVSISIKERK